jgi:hypothetical protein
MRSRTISERENFLRTVEFNYPEWIPIKFELMPALWIKYGDRLQEIVDRHPLIFSPDDPGGYSFNFHEGDPFYTNNDTGRCAGAGHASSAGRLESPGGVSSARPARPV